MNLIFFVSGFAGLIYESIWTHYLKLFLGHAAYAQTLVLVIFMGGMAIGAALSARFTTRMKSPLLVYAGIEATIGVLALSFHYLFNAMTHGFYAAAFDQQLSGASFHVLKWTLAALIILPQSVLLGATFPVFAAALTRRSQSTGRSLATLYFANSMGGALGVLASGFYLVPTLGLPGTIALAGSVNLLLGAVTAWMAKGQGRGASSGQPTLASAPFGALPQLLVLVSFLTGASSFMYEIGWIRMLSLVLGSATHSFELMLFAFIVGLALGGLWVRKYIDTSANPGLLLAKVQIMMGVAAIATLPLHSLTFDIAAWVAANTPKSDGGYVLLNLVRYGLSSLIMLPAAFCAGMTLPLVTKLLFASQHQGERAIGMVYSANTIGAISGVVFAVYVGLPMLGLNNLIAAGALIDVGLGMVLWMVFAGRAQWRKGVLVMGACLGAALASATTFNPQKLVSGAFRSGKASIEGTVIALSHGRTATVSVEETDGTLAIRTNGKPDAAARLPGSQGYEIDEVTMSLIGALPLMLHDAPARVANIGFGSGMTGEVLLTDPRVRQLDTIEIEPAMVKLARHFGDINRRVYEDPRSTIHIDDAKSFFASNGQRYDLIVSEPSNPWVSGVAGLFSVEFYRHVSRYLNEGGLFAQWIQLYETHPDRVTSVIKALDQSFDDYLLLALDYGDVLLVARPRGKLQLTPEAFDALAPQLRQKLRRLDIANASDVSTRVIGNKAFFKPWLDQRRVPANSDFAPYLDTHADSDRFLFLNWRELAELSQSPYPIAEVMGQRAAMKNGALLSINSHFGADPPALAGRLTLSTLVPGSDSPQADVLPVPAMMSPGLLTRARQVVADCANPPAGDRSYALAGLAIKALPYLPPGDARAVLDAARRLPCFTGLTPEQQPWVQLLEQVVARDAKGFGATAQDLLERGQGATEVRKRYLLGMAVLGHLGAGDQAGAKAIWQKHARTALGTRPPGLALELLRDHALHGAAVAAKP